MRSERVSTAVAVMCLLGTVSLRAQSRPGGDPNSDSNTGTSPSVVPRLIKFSGEINPQIPPMALTKGTESGKNMLPTAVAITFSLYELQEGGSPLWSEAQKVQLDEQGHYTVLLGSTQADGLPLDLFTSGKALWLGIQPQSPGGVEQPRVLLVAVPYALKAADADTLGGLPASAYAVAEHALSAANGPSPPGVALSQSGSTSFVNGQRTTGNGPLTSGPQPGAPCPSVTSDGKATATSVAMFTTNCNLEASAITQTSGNVGISGTSPANTKFQITDTPAPDFGTHYTNHELLNSSVTKNGTNKGLTFVMDATNMAISKGVTDSGYRIGVEGAAYANTAGFVGTLASQYGVWGRAGINAATSGATVSNAYAGYFDIFNAVAGTKITNAYGVYIANTGTTGTITNRYDLYASSANGKSYFAGNVGIGTTTPAAALEVNGTAKFDQAVTFAAANTFSTAQTINSGDLSLSNGDLDLASTTGATSGVINLGGTPFIHECCNAGFGFTNTFVGLSAGNFANTGHDNTGYGFQALQSLTTGDFNTATGYLALQAATTGLSNTGTGLQALRSNTTGSDNTATGANALFSNVTGSGNTATGQGALNLNTANDNTADGSIALSANTTGTDNTATGTGALTSNTTGSNNTAVGDGALLQNTTADQNTAVGVSALLFSTGFGNTAVGGFAGAVNSTNANKTGARNTFIGWSSGPGVSTEIDNATAIGANAVVSESNALVLGGTGANAVNVGIGTATPSTTLEVNGVATFDMPVAFAAGQAFPGTVTAVTAGTDLTGGGAGGILTLNLDTTKVPQLATTNTFAAAQTISSGDLSLSGGDLDLPATTASTSGVVNLGGNPFLHACCPNSMIDTFVGSFAGNFTADTSSTHAGIGANTGVGFAALTLLSSGYSNTAVGVDALKNNNSGFENTAEGAASLFLNATGNNNTAVGTDALLNNTSGSFNSAVGYNAGQAGTTSEKAGDHNTYIGAGAGPGTNSTLTGATAIGANATVGSDFTLILGGTGTNAVTVGIGTATPFTDYALDVEDTAKVGIDSGVVVNANGGNIFLGLTNGAHKFRVDTNGEAHGAGFVTSGADFAESVAVRGSTSGYEPGDLLVIDPSGKRRLTLSRKPYSTLVAGIYSTKPGMLATPHPVDAKFEGEVPLAVVGIVPCKVTAQNGAIREGDLLVTSSRPGYAMKGTDRRRMLGAVVGKALEPLPKGTGVIQVLVTLQ